MGWTIEATAEAPVPPEAVFALYMAPDTWSRWGHNATWARAIGPVAEGSTIEVRAGYGKVYPCRVRRLEPDHALELVVKPPGMTIINVYQVSPSASGGSRIRHAFEISGPMGMVSRFIGLGRVYRRKLEAEVAAVGRMAADATNGGGSPGVSVAGAGVDGADR
jgi:hypothetical protein